MPPGWQSWASPVQGNAYAQTHYKLNVDGDVDADFHERLPRLVARAARPSTWSTGGDGFDFAEGGQFVYYASYSPHTPYAYPKSLRGHASRTRTYPADARTSTRPTPPTSSG